MSKKEEIKKKHMVPILDFTKVRQISTHKRRNSDTELLTNKTLKRKNIDDVIQKHRETCLLIKDLHSSFELLKQSNYNEYIFRETVKDLKERISSLEGKDPENTPRILSRCDALVGNTRLTLENTQSHTTSLQNISKHLHTIDEETEHHDIVTVTLLNDIIREIYDIKITLKNLEMMACRKNS